MRDKLHVFSLALLFFFSDTWGVGLCIFFWLQDLLRAERGTKVFILQSLKKKQPSASMRSVPFGLIRPLPVRRGLYPSRW